MGEFGPVWESFLTGLPWLVIHLGTATAILVAGVAFYIWYTPWSELGEIRKGNSAAALSFGAAIIGLALPLGLSLSASVNVLDILVWGLLAVLLQLIAFRAIDLLLRRLPQRIEDGEIAAAITLASAKLAAAILNAAAIVG